MKAGLKRQKSISSQAASISACITVFDWLSMVAAFATSRHGPASRSAALSRMAARASHGISDHSRHAFAAASTAIATSFSPAWW